MNQRQERPGCGFEKEALLARFQHPNRKDARKMIVKPKRLGRLVGERC